jgi:hypothetical protein
MDNEPDDFQNSSLLRRCIGLFFNRQRVASISWAVDTWLEFGSALL